jgi:hypothetical protein
VDFWQYNEAARLYGPKDCVKTVQDTVQLVDNILMGNDSTSQERLKALAGFPKTTENKDFARLFSSGLEGWQSRHWHPKQNSAYVDTSCRALARSTLSSPKLEAKRKIVEDLMKAAKLEVDDAFVNKFLNKVYSIQWSVGFTCSLSGKPLDKCISIGKDSAFVKRTDIRQTWRSWSWQ